MKLDFTGIIKFNKKLNRQTELKDKKKSELDKYNLSLDKLEEQLNKLREKEYKILSKLPEGEASINLEENLAKQEAKQEAINKKKEKILSINATYEKYEKRYLKLVSEKNTGIIDLDLKIAQIEDKIDELRQNWDKAAEKLNENYAQMRKMNKDSQEYKDLEEENEGYREVMKNSVITSETGTKLKNELEELKNMKRILENGEVIEELVKEPEKKEKVKKEQEIEVEEKEPPINSVEDGEIKEEVLEAKEAEEKITETDRKATVKTTVVPKVQTPKTNSSPRTQIKRVIIPQQEKQTITKEPEINSEPNEEPKIVSKDGLNQVDKVLEKYKNDGFGENAFGWYFNPWKSEYDPEYDPHNDEEYNEELKNSKKEPKNIQIETKDTQESLYTRVINILKNRIKNFIQRISKYNTKRLPAGTSKEEYVAKSNKILSETMEQNHVFDANSRAAMQNSRQKFVGTIKVDTNKLNENKEPMAVTAEASKTEKDNVR